MLTPIWNFHLYAAYDCTMDYELSENGIINKTYSAKTNSKGIASIKLKGRW